MMKTLMLKGQSLYRYMIVIPHGSGRGEGNVPMRCDSSAMASHSSRLPTQVNSRNRHQRAIAGT